MPSFNFKIKSPDVFDFIVANGGNDYREKFPEGIPATLTVEAEDSSNAQELIKIFTNLEMWEIQAD